MQFVNGKGVRAAARSVVHLGWREFDVPSETNKSVGLEPVEKGFGMKKLLTGLLGVAAVAWTASAVSATTLDDVKAKGFLQCGVNTGLPGFAAPDDKGEWTGFDVDYCRAVAAAVF